MTVCPSTNTLKHLEGREQDDLLYYKFEPAEWKYEMQGADMAFSAISKILNEELLTNEYNNDRENNKKRFVDFQKQLYETCFNVLLELKNEEFFTEITRKPIFLTFCVSDYEFGAAKQKQIISALNDEFYKKEYFNWMKTFGQ